MTATFLGSNNLPYVIYQPHLSHQTLCLYTLKFSTIQPLVMVGNPNGFGQHLYKVQHPHFCFSTKQSENQTRKKL